MEKQKIVKKLAFSLIGLFVLALIVFSIFQHKQIKNIFQDSNSETAAVSESTADTMQKAETQSVPLTTKEREHYEKKIDQLQSQVEDAEDELDSVYAEKYAKDSDKDTSDVPSNKTAFKQFSSSMKTMLKDPAMKKMLRVQSKANLDITYGALFEELDLTPEELENFKEILTDYRMATVEASYEIVDAKSVDDMKRISEQTKALRDEYDAKIAAFLGAEDNKKYKAYEETQGERNIVSGFTQTLVPSEQLSKQQEEELMDLMYKERKSYYASTGYDSGEQKEFTLPNEETIAKAVDRLNHTYDKYREAGENILSTSQMKKFEEFLKQRRDMNESTIKMSAQLLGVQTTQKSTDKKSE